MEQWSNETCRRSTTPILHRPNASMNPKHTWWWVSVAVALCAFIFLYGKFSRKPEAGPIKVLPGLKAADVSSIQARPDGQQIHAERTNDTWQLTEPLFCPARKAAIETLLGLFENLTAKPITAQEIKNYPKPNEEFGFDSPQATIILEGNQRHTILIGNSTAPGDEVFVQVIGAEGIYIVNADLLKWIPRNANDWRDTKFVDLGALKFDRLIVTNAGKPQPLEFQRDPTNKLWRLTGPTKARADSDKIEESLRQVQNLRVRQFVSDDPRADLDFYGLPSAGFSLALGQGTNTVLLLQFGKSPTNAADLVFARRADRNSIVTVSKDLLEPWHGTEKDFRDRHLVTLTRPLDEIEVHAGEDFTLQGQASNTWRILEQKFPVDPVLAREFIGNLAGLQVAQFVKDEVTDLGLPLFGLKSPLRKYILKTADTNAAGVTNIVIAQIDFGTNQDGQIFAKRADESFVYEIKPSDFQQLPSAGWQLRDRRIWNFSTNDVTRITIHQNGKTREIVRTEANTWSLAPGSQGVINVFAPEEISYRLGKLAAAAWVDRGDQNRARCGFTPDSLRLTIELKSGEKREIEFGGDAPSQFPYAAVALDGQTWIFEFPVDLYYKLVLPYLTIP